ncbi:hypothetical protein FB567DRAFT_516541 [Paraphoma chrysanthemicola]|uniref:AB hydrolase-1 domain-containing protein n=1 Tax=Paraphoma chrysanthemicola TaxID=798071 RepID=A0A8K0RFI8_9PLEO|nr:hypothetical protein FB567DRAFT_516541 [Paraphoma chrysanthemicola]
MRKTIVLCFIHGFKGGDDTFGNFPSHLKALLQHALPKVTILTITYPKYETRGDLTECVARFKEWLTNKIIDLEVANSTPSPTVDPSVHTILVGHSMGGIVAAETLLSITGDQPLHSLKNSQIGSTMLEEHSTLMFPYIQGILAFDTPYLGIAPGVVAHGAEKHWQTANSAYSAYSNLAGAFGWGKKDTAPTVVDSSRMLPAPSSDVDVASAPLWQRYGKVAMFAGAAGAIAAGGAAAYMKRDQISEGLNWATSHLEFIGALARPEEMQKRLAKVTKFTTQSDFGFCNMHTTLGHAVNSQQQTSKESWTGKVAGKDRTFCNLPKGELKNFFIPAVNDKGTAETWAHMNMFEPKNNPGYYTLSETAKEKIIEWAETPWYEESEGPLVGEVGEEAEIVERQEVDEAMQKEAEEREREMQEEFVDLKRGPGTPVDGVSEGEERKKREL